MEKRIHNWINEGERMSSSRNSSSSSRRRREYNPAPGYLLLWHKKLALIGLQKAVEFF